MHDHRGSLFPSVFVEVATIVRATGPVVGDAYAIACGRWLDVQGLGVMNGEVPRVGGSASRTVRRFVVDFAAYRAPNTVPQGHAGPLSH